MEKPVSNEDLVDDLIRAARVYEDQADRLRALRYEVLNRMVSPEQENREPIRESQLSDFLDHSD